jgi:hypothetical protein
MRLLIIFICFSFFSFGQSELKGKIIDKKIKAAIPFATVGLVKENIGTNADEQGNFILVSQHQFANDSLIISCVGYETVRMPFDKYSLATPIELIERVTQLKEVTVLANHKWKSTTLNDFSGCGNHTLTTNGTQSQAAQHFLAPVENSILTEVEICTGVGPFYFKRSRFRIRVYDMDSISKAPSSDLSDEVIEINSTGKHETADLEKYNIHIPHRDFFIAVEWLKIPDNIERQESNAVSDTLYRPHIGFKESVNNSGEVWSLYYNNTWFRDSFIDHLHIAATINY